MPGFSGGAERNSTEKLSLERYVVSGEVPERLPAVTSTIKPSFAHNLRNAEAEIMRRPGITRSTIA